MNRKLTLGVVPLMLALAAPCQADIYYYKDIRTGSLYVTNIVETNPAYKLQRVQRSLQLSDLNANKRKIKPLPLSYSPSYALPGSSAIVDLNPAISRKRGKPFRVNEENRKLYAPHIEQVARTYGLDPKLVHAVISAESAYNPQAVSIKGAMGLMQLMPDTAKRFGVQNPLNPLENLHGGARYLRWLMNRFKNIHLAVAAYNAGEGAVERYGNTIPPYAETQTYVTRVLDFYGYSQPLN